MTLLQRLTVIHHTLCFRTIVILPLPHLIFTSDCAGPHGEIEARLNQINPPGGWYDSTNDVCGLGVGVEFYGANLTPDQVAEFGATVGAFTVVADEELVDDEGSVVIQNEWQSGPPMPLSKFARNETKLSFNGMLIGTCFFFPTLIRCHSHIMTFYGPVPGPVIVISPEPVQGLWCML